MKLEPKELDLSSINSGNQFVDGDVFHAGYLNQTLQGIAYAQNSSRESKEQANKAIATANQLNKDSNAAKEEAQAAKEEAHAYALRAERASNEAAGLTMQRYRASISGINYDAILPAISNYGDFEYGEGLCVGVAGRVGFPNHSIFPDAPAMSEFKTYPVYLYYKTYYVYNIEGKDLPQYMVPVGDPITPPTSSGSGFNIDQVYPVGSIYSSYDSGSPAARFGGTWSQIRDAFLWAIGATPSYTDYQTRHILNVAGGKGGAYSRKIQTSQMPAHSHRLKGLAYEVAPSSSSKIYALAGSDVYDNFARNTGDTGENVNFCTMPPYYCVYVWRRTA